MKFWQLFLAFYVVVLSALPCDAFCQEERIPAAQTSQPASEDHQHDERCSPFCLCAACPGFIIPPAARLIVTVNVATRIAVARLPHYQAPHALDVPGRIWQPPRV